MKLPRFCGVFDSFVDYGSVVTTVRYGRWRATVGGPPAYPELPSSPESAVFGRSEVIHRRPTYPPDSTDEANRLNLITF